MMFHIEHIRDVVRTEAARRFKDPIPKATVSDAVRAAFQMCVDLDVHLPLLYVEPPIVHYDASLHPDIIEAWKQSQYICQVHVGGSPYYINSEYGQSVVLWVKRSDSDHYASRHVLMLPGSDRITEEDADSLYLDLTQGTTSNPVYMYDKSIEDRRTRK